MDSPATAANAGSPVLPYAPQPAPGKPLSRMPLLWVAVLVPAAFVFVLSVMLPSL